MTSTKFIYNDINSINTKECHDLILDKFKMYFLNYDKEDILLKIYRNLRLTDFISKNEYTNTNLFVLLDGKLKEIFQLDSKYEFYNFAARHPDVLLNFHYKYFLEKDIINGKENDKQVQKHFKTAIEVYYSLLTFIHLFIMITDFNEIKERDMEIYLKLLLYKLEKNKKLCQIINSEPLKFYKFNVDNLEINKVFENMLMKSNIDYISNEDYCKEYVQYNSQEDKYAGYNIMLQKIATLKYFNMVYSLLDLIKKESKTTNYYELIPCEWIIV